MRTMTTAALVFLVLGCATTVPAPDSPERAKLRSAENVIDAFYSFDPKRLEETLAGARESVPRMVYYQGWAKGGHYEIIDRRPCAMTAADMVECPVTVRDDLIPALGVDMHVTDTFHLKFEGDSIVHVRTSSNDPAVMGEALEWFMKEKPDVMKNECRGFFAGGPTPGECVQAVVKGFREFTASRR